MIRLGAASAVALLLLGGCSSTDNSQVAAGPGDPMATTAPLAVPPVLRQPDPAQAVDPNMPLATTAPLAAPEPASTDRASAEPVATQPAVSSDDPDPVATAAPSSTPAADEVLAATAVPAQETAAPAGSTVRAATTAPADPSAATQTAAPAAAVENAPAAAAPVQSAGGPTISLGDFEVVNLITQQDQNIAELSPNGATMLWFWAPH